MRLTLLLTDVRLCGADCTASFVGGINTEGLDIQTCTVSMIQYGIVAFNIPLDILYVISEMILRVKWPNQQCQSTVIS